jgi:hypothetical protein
MLSRTDHCFKSNDPRHILCGILSPPTQKCAFQRWAANRRGHATGQALWFMTWETVRLEARRARLKNHACVGRRTGDRFLSATLWWTLLRRSEAWA